MCALRKIDLQPVQRFPRNTRNARGQCGQIASPRAENFAAGGSNCRGRGDPDFAKNGGFIGFSVMARRLLMLEPGS
jgi:hypothetical protein